MKISDFPSACCKAQVVGEGQCEACGAPVWYTRIVYIAGPYRSKTVRGMVLNIRAAEEVAVKWWKAGFAVICPHTNSALFDGELPDEAYLTGDMTLLSKCDAIAMVSGWEKSEGAKHELEWAKAAGLKVVM